MRSITLAGMPSFLGGADTEADHWIDLMRMHDVDVNLVPMFGCDPRMSKLCIQRGCKIHDYNPTIFKDKIVVSFCNGEFLRLLPEIVENGKPRCTIFFNCMTWLFDNEKNAHSNKYIDYFGFVSNYQKNRIKPELEKINPVNEIDGYLPFFNPKNIAQSIDFKYSKPERWFSLGRVSRDDGGKYSHDMWNIFYKVCTPISKKIFILGFGKNARVKCGSSPVGLDVMTWDAGVIPVKELYKILHCIVHKTGGSRESYCRIVPEAYAAGVPMIVEDDYAFPDLIINGVTGYRCKTSDEMSYRASELAFDEEKRKKMIYSAYSYLINEISSKEKCWKPWEKIFKTFGTNNVI